MFEIMKCCIHQDQDLLSQVLDFSFTYLVALKWLRIWVLLLPNFHEQIFCHHAKFTTFIYTVFFFPSKFQVKCFKLKIINSLQICLSFMVKKKKKISRFGIYWWIRMTTKREQITEGITLILIFSHRNMLLAFWIHGSKFHGLEKGEIWLVWLVLMMLPTQLKQI